MEQLINEWNDCKLIKIFEYPVRGRRYGEYDYVTFDIVLNEENKTFEASHVALNEEQAKSNKIAFVEIEIDDCFGLDEHLQELATACSEAIHNSEFFVMGEH